MKIIVIGGVNSTLSICQKLVEHELLPSAIYGFEPSNSGLVSGFVSLQPFAEKHHVPFTPFKKINDHVDEIKRLDADIIFLVGLSQLASKGIINSANLACIGFHPTALPRGRGRAPIAWLVLEEKCGAVNFFVVGEGADDGAILCSQHFTIEENDSAASVEHKILLSLNKVLDVWLPQLKRGIWQPVPQDEAQATYYGVRKSEDGFIDWVHDSGSIDKLIRASSHPHPGAYSYLGNVKMTIWKSRKEAALMIKGVIGRILIINADKELLVQTGDGLIWLSEYEFDICITPQVGSKIGLNPQEEVVKLYHEIERLKEMIHQ